jgi:hypothetical protein
MGAVVEDISELLNGTEMLEEKKFEFDSISIFLQGPCPR